MSTDSKTNSLFATVRKLNQTIKDHKNKNNYIFFCLSIVFLLFFTFLFFFKRFSEKFITIKEYKIKNSNIFLFFIIIFLISSIYFFKKSKLPFENLK